MPEQIGSISILHGTATAESAEGSRALSQGDPVFEGDVVSTHDTSSLEIHFTDHTILAQGSGSVVNLDHYVFDGDSGQGDLLFKLAQGTFRTITGEIVHTNPEGFVLESPLATIGIRGTSVATHIPPPGSADPTEQHLVLVYDGKPVLIIPKADGTFRLLSESGQKVDVGELAASEIQIMTRAEFEYYQQFSPFNMGEQTPRYESPDDVPGPDDGSDGPVSGQEFQDAANQDASARGDGNPYDGGTGNGADANQGDDNQADGDSSDDDSSDDDPLADVAPEDFARGGDSDNDATSGSSDKNTLTGSGEEAGLQNNSLLSFTLTGGTMLSGSISAAAQQVLGQYYAAVGAATSTTGNTGLLLPTPTTTTTTTPTTVSGTTDLSSLSSSITSVTVTGTTPNISTTGTSIAGGGTMTVDGSALTTALTFNGSSVTNSGYFNVKGGSAGDSITGSDHNPDGDTLFGYAGMDTLIGMAGNDTIYGGDGNDTIYGENNGGTVTAGQSYNDTIYGEGGDDTIKGDEGNDTIYGGNGNDDIDGGSGTDTLYGNDGNDTFHSSDGADTVDGGAGTDSFTYATSTAAVSVTLGASSGNTGGQAAGDVLTNIETLFGSAYNDTLTGSSNADTLNGKDGNDTLYGKDGADTLLGGIGDDTFKYGLDCDLESGESINGEAHTTKDTISLTGTSTTFSFTGVTISNIEELLIGSGSTASFDSSHVAEVSTWTIHGNTTVGTVETLQFTSTTGTLNLSGLTNFGDWNNSEDIIFLKGSSGDDTITGTDHDDTVTGGNGQDTLSGGAGTDTLSFETDGGSQSVECDLTAAGYYDSFGNYDAKDLTFENLTLTNYNDRGWGDAGNNTLSGLAGDDTLDGRTGNDTLFGGAGADTISGGAGTDIFYYADKTQGGDTITDFASVDDTFRAVQSGFLLSGTTYGTHWTFDDSGTSAAPTLGNNTPTFFFDDETDNLHHVLYYDPDGSDTGHGLYNIADIGSATMAAADIEIVT